MCEDFGDVKNTRLQHECSVEDSRQDHIETKKTLTTRDIPFMVNSQMPF